MDNKMPWWVAPGLGTFIIIAFAGAMFASFFTNDAAQRNILVGGSIALANQVIGFYFGSSASSQKKDETVAALANNQK